MCLPIKGKRKKEHCMVIWFLTRNLFKRPDDLIKLLSPIQAARVGEAIDMLWISQEKEDKEEKMALVKYVKWILVNLVYIYRELVFSSTFVYDYSHYANYCEFIMFILQEGWNLLQEVSILQGKDSELVETSAGCFTHDILSVIPIK